MFKCLLRLAFVLKEFSGASLTLHDVNGHVGGGLLAVLQVGVDGGLPAAESGFCGCGWVMAGVCVGRLRSSRGVVLSDLI